jgi:hydrogenase maturation protein HypF
MRRSRGYVPTPIPLVTPVPRPILACGAQLKNTFCLAAGNTAFLGPHIGDLDNAATMAAFEEAVARLSLFTGIIPEVIAHDSHPDYLSTRYALTRPEARKVGVQHHHAHVVSAMAEHGLKGSVVGVAYDGTGLGDDGTAWGGEILACGLGSYARLCTLRPIRLAGGDRSMSEVWRIALALLDDAFDGQAPLDGLHLFSKVDPAKVAGVRSLLAAGLNSPLAHGAGRYFDALGALLLGLPEARFEGQVAMALNVAAADEEQGGYPFVIDRSGSTAQIDLRPMVRRLVGDLRDGTPTEVVAARFHDTLASATALFVLGSTDPTLPVILTGGCFQNDRLTASLVRRLRPERTVFLHSQVPCGDGGLALGQALVAGAVLDAEDSLPRGAGGS